MSWGRTLFEPPIHWPSYYIDVDIVSKLHWSSVGLLPFVDVIEHACRIFEGKNWSSGTHATIDGRLKTMRVMNHVSNTSGSSVHHHFLPCGNQGLLFFPPIYERWPSIARLCILITEVNRTFCTRVFYVQESYHEESMPSQGLHPPPTRSHSCASTPVGI